MAALGGSLSRRYARALFAIGVDKGTFEAMGRELEELSLRYRQSDELRHTLENPIFKMAEKRAILDQILPRLASSPELKSFILLLLERNRIAALPAIARSYLEMTDQQLGRVRATVTSAVALDPSNLGSVQRALERRTGKQVVMTTTIDPALIGGIVARVGDLVLDGSIRTQLQTLRNRVVT